MERGAEVPLEKASTRELWLATLHHWQVVMTLETRGSICFCKDSRGFLPISSNLVRLKVSPYLKGTEGKDQEMGKLSYPTVELVQKNRQSRGRRALGTQNSRTLPVCEWVPGWKLSQVRFFTACLTILPSAVFLRVYLCHRKPMPSHFKLTISFNLVVGVL